MHGRTSKCQYIYLLIYSIDKRRPKNGKTINMNRSGYFFSPRRVAGKAYEYELQYYVQVVLLRLNNITCTIQYFILGILFALHLSYKRARTHARDDDKSNKNRKRETIRQTHARETDGRGGGAYTYYYRCCRVYGNIYIGVYRYTTRI